MIPATDSELLARVGPGLGSAPALAWNAFAFAAGKRLLIAMANAEGEQHVVDICSHALAMVALPQALIDEPDAAVTIAMVEATLHPMTMFSRSPAAAWFMRVFKWGLRRPRKDRWLSDSLVSLARDACELQATIAEQAGGDRIAALESERAAQAADARAVLAGGLGPSP